MDNLIQSFEDTDISSIDEENSNYTFCIMCNTSFISRQNITYICSKSCYEDYKLNT